MSMSISKNNVIVWNRVSTPQQLTNFSLEIQEKMCREFLINIMNIKNVNKVLNNIGSAFTPNDEMKKSYKLLYNSPSPFVVCLSVDRFSRNEKYGLSVYEKIMKKNGRMIFILDRLDTINPDHKDILIEKLKQAETESKIKSLRMKNSYQFATNMKIKTALNDLSKIRLFINSMIYGDKVQNIYKIFRELVDWESHPDWQEFYETPIEFTNVYLCKRYKVECIPNDDVSLEGISSILNDYWIKIPIQRIKNKKWSKKLLESIIEVENDDFKNVFGNMKI